MNICFLNVGYGESIVINNPGFCMVVDGGSNRPLVYQDKSTIKLTDFLRKSGIEKIDLMVSTHLHDDHIGGLIEAVKEFPVKEIWFNMIPEDFDLINLEEKKQLLDKNNYKKVYLDGICQLEQLIKIIKEKNIPMKEVCLEDGEVEAGGLTITPLGMNVIERNIAKIEFEKMLGFKEEKFLKAYLENDSLCNATSLALHIREGRKGILLTADKIFDWKLLSDRFNLKANVLKLAHHGQLDGMPESMLFAADPEVIVICSDRNRKYNSANPEIIQRAEEYLSQKKCSGNIYITGSLTISHDHGDSAICIAMDEKGTEIVSI